MSFARLSDKGLNTRVKYSFQLCHHSVQYQYTIQNINKELIKPSALRFWLDYLAGKSL